MKISLNRNHLIRSLSVYGAFLLLLIFLGCQNSVGTENKNKVPVAEELITLSQQQFDHGNLTLGTLSKSIFYNAVRSNGHFEILPENKVIVSSFFGGRVKNLKLIPGSPVIKGQHLFQIENPEFIKLQETYLTAKGQIKNLQANFERQKSLYLDSLTSEKIFLKSESEYFQTKVKMESVGKQLEMMHLNPQELTYANIKTAIHIKAPLSGYVSSINAVNGANIDPSQEALTILNADRLHLELFIFEKDFSKIKEGQPILFNLQNDSKNTYSAEVHLLNKSVDPEQRTITIHADLFPEDMNDKFIPGLFVEALIRTEKSTELALPKEAVTRIDGRNYVLRLQDVIAQQYNFEKVEVQLGKTNENSVQILNAQTIGLESQFLLNGSFQLIAE